MLARLILSLAVVALTLVSLFALKASAQPAPVLSCECKCNFYRGRSRVVQAHVVNGTCDKKPSDPTQCRSWEQTACADVCKQQLNKYCGYSQDIECKGVGACFGLTPCLGQGCKIGSTCIQKNATGPGKKPTCWGRLTCTDCIGSNSASNVQLFSSCCS